MNDDAFEETRLLEARLRKLCPSPAAENQADLFYRAGCASGRAAALREGRHRSWTRVVLAASVAALLVAPLSYRFGYGVASLRPPSQSLSAGTAASTSEGPLNGQAAVPERDRRRESASPVSPSGMEDSSVLDDEESTRLSQGNPTDRESSFNHSTWGDLFALLAIPIRQAEGAPTSRGKEARMLTASHSRTVIDGVWRFPENDESIGVSASAVSNKQRFERGLQAFPADPRHWAWGDFVGETVNR